jgi:hypothetical protein
VEVAVETLALLWVFSALPSGLRRYSGATRLSLLTPFSSRWSVDIVEPEATRARAFRRRWFAFFAFLGVVTLGKMVWVRVRL